MNCQDPIRKRLNRLQIQNTEPGNGTGHMDRNISSLINLKPVAGKFSAGYMSRMVLSGNVHWKEHPELQAAGKKLIGCRHMVPDMLKVFEKEDVFISDNQIFNFF